MPQFQTQSCQLSSRTGLEVFGPTDWSVCVCTVAERGCRSGLGLSSALEVSFIFGTTNIRTMESHADNVVFGPSDWSVCVQKREAVDPVWDISSAA